MSKKISKYTVRAELHGAKDYDASMRLVERGHPSLAGLREARAIIEELMSDRDAIVEDNRSQEPPDDNNKPGEDGASDRPSDPPASRKHRRCRSEDSLGARDRTRSFAPGGRRGERTSRGGAR